LVPVRYPNVEKVKGGYYFSFDKQGKRLDDDWIPKDYEGRWIDKKALEIIIYWIYGEPDLSQQVLE
jgi:hypothetical protein